MTEGKASGKAGILAVGVGSAPNSQKLIEWAKRASDSREIPWCAIHVDDGATLGVAEKARLDGNLELARSCGARVIVALGDDVAGTFIETARTQGANTLVIGCSGLSGVGFLRHRTSISDRILRNANPLDVVVVGDVPRRNMRVTLASMRRLFSVPWRQYALMCGVFVLATLACLWLGPVLEHRSVALLYLAAVLFLSLVSGPVPVVLLAVISSIAYNFFFIPPLFAFAISLEDLLLTLLYALVAAVTGFLSARLRSRERMLAKKDREATFLLSSAEGLSSAENIEEAANASAEIIDRYSGSSSVVYIGKWEDCPDEFFGKASKELSAEERESAMACISTGRTTGPCSGKISSSSLHFVPAWAGTRTVAAIGYSTSSKKNRVEDDDHLVAALGRNLALFIERTRSEMKSRNAAIELESERLAKVLFDSVSHELKTPLTTITGSLSALLNEDIASSASIRRELIDGALASAIRLTKIVEDLLSIGRIEAGALKLKRSPAEASELAWTAVSAVSANRGSRTLNVVLPDEPRVYRVDAVLVNRLAVNLLENAMKYSTPGQDIDLMIAGKEDGLSLTVRDGGPGFSAERMQHPFAKFSKKTGDSQGGLGLGLAICKGIAEAHGGRLDARRSDLGFEVEAVFPDCAEGECDAGSRDR
jgi:two-component system sensor histidine kinase KdpD